MKEQQIAPSELASVDEINVAGIAGGLPANSVFTESERTGSCAHMPISRSRFISSCIQIEEASLLAKFQVHVVTSPEKTTGIVLDRRPGALHKYLMTRDETGHQYLLSMPVAWIRRHRNILERLEAASSKMLEVAGGGFIMWAGQLLVYGLSVEFGAGDHNYARTEFNNAISTAPIFSPHYQE